MCRDNSHGGRRCPNDTSAARSARRRNRKNIEGFIGTDSVVKLRSQSAGESPVVEEVARAADTPWGDGVTDDHLFGRVKIDDPTFAKLVSEKRVAALKSMHEETAHLRGDNIIDFAEGQRLLPHLRKTGYLMEAEVRYRLGPDFDTQEQTIIDGYTNDLDKIQKEMEDASNSSGSHFREKVALKREVFELRKELPGADSTRQEEINMEILDKESKISQLEDGQKKFHDLFEEHRQRYISKANELNAQRDENVAVYANAVQSVLADIRPMGTSDGDINAHSSSQKPAQAIIRDIHQFYPSTWWDRSNQGGAIHYRATAGRAHYIHQGKLVKKKMKLPTVFSDDMSFDEPTPDKLSIERKVHVTFKPGDKEYEPLIKRMHMYGNYDDREGTGVIHVMADADFHIPEDGPLKGSGWIPVHDEDGNIKYHKRARMVNTLIEAESMAEITIGGKTSTQKRENALHEMSHRFEHTNKNIGKLERAFYMHRVTDDNGNVEELHHYTGGSKSEVVRDDEFLNVYMGKDYQRERGEDYPAYELLSMGMESVFSGSNGGLRGLHKTGKKDDDMRFFIMGLLANN